MAFSISLLSFWVTAIVLTHLHIQHDLVMTMNPESKGDLDHVGLSTFTDKYLRNW